MTWTVETTQTGQGAIATLLRDGRPVYMTWAGPAETPFEAIYSAHRVGCAFARMTMTLDSDASERERDE